MCVRSYAAGVFVGYLEEKEATPAGLIVKIRNVRRIWHWSGAASLSQLAKEGVKNPDDCKFSVINDEVIVVNVVEMIPLTEDAKKSIYSVKEWSE